MKPTLLILLLILIQVLSFSQENENRNVLNELKEPVPGAGNVNINQDVTIEKILNQRIYQNKKQEGIPGFRINIFFDSGFDKAGVDARTRAFAVRDTFNVYHPDIPSYFKFETPNYKVYVGDFRTKTDALKVFKWLKREYPKAFIVNDKINFINLD
ncbi:MAG: SPOR domain-containing protein [Bacteroidales bacterium]|nr:SPOR domain-containing protein [Bacteroidales bacterium]